MPTPPPIEPVPTLVWTRTSQHHLRRVGDHTLALVSRWGRIWQGWAIAWFLMLAGLALVLGYESGSGKVLTLSRVVAGLALAVAAGVGALPRIVGPIAPRARFDRRRGVVILNAPAEGLRGQIPLARVEALQLLPAGPKPGEGGPFASYQLNLVLSAEPGRLNLLHHGDAEALRRTAAEIAGFLGVPLVDRT